MTGDSPSESSRSQSSIHAAVRTVVGEANSDPVDGDGVDRGTGRLVPDGGEDESEEGESEGEDESEADESEEEAADEGDESEAAEEGEDEQHEESGGEGTQVLFLDLEGLFLNLLGLEVDLNEIVLDVSAVPGEGRLLGNLLSAVGGLLDSDLGDLLGGGLSGLLGGVMPDGEEGESKVSDAAGSAKEAISDVTDDLPVDELMSQIAAEVVRQLLGGRSDGQEGEGEAAEASG